MSVQSRRNQWIFWGLILVLGTVIYSSSVSVPFQFDDPPNITMNRSLHQLSNIRLIWELNARTRFLPSLSFAVNFFFGQTDVWGYHLFNIALHIFNSFWVYFLVLFLLATPRMRESCPQEVAVNLAGLTALLFLCHPLQTQAVTYIVQRMTSMAAFFYLGAIVFYLKARLDQRRFYYDMALAMTFAAMFCKENAFTLPIMLAMLEAFCFGISDGKNFLMRLLPFLLMLGVIPMLLHSGIQPDLVPHSLVPIQKGALSHGSYFLTELNVLCTYLRLFVFPVNQNADYDYPIAHSILETKTLACFFLLAVLFVFAIGMCRKNRLLAFSIFWFFLTLSVESSVFPIVDVIAEQRMYLPLVGCAIFLSVALYELFKKQSYFLAAGIMMILVFSGMTYARNQVWRTGISFWEDVVRQSPNKARGYNNLGNLYIEVGQKKKGRTFLEKAYQKDPNYFPAVFNLAALYEYAGEMDRAVNLFQKAVELSPGDVIARDRLGLVCRKVGNSEKAMESFEKAIRINPLYAPAYKHLGIIFKEKGDRAQAVKFLKKSLQLDPYNKRTIWELYKVYLRQDN